MHDAARSGEATAPPLWQALLLAAEAWQGLRDGAALDRALDAARLAQGAGHPRAAAAAKDIAYTAVRHLALIDWIVARLAHRAPPPQVEALLSVALGQVLGARHPPYAIVDQAVEAAKRAEVLRGAAGFVNGLLRNALRQLDELRAQAERDERIRFNLPGWWLQRLQRDYPDSWQVIAEVQRRAAPLTLRVDTERVTLADYIALCAQAGLKAQRVGPAAVRLEPPRPVEQIPGFVQGDVTVQDAGAQLAVPWLAVADGMRVLDACAAPGGKTAQLACAAALSLDAIEMDPARVGRIEANLQRLNARARSQVTIHTVDAGDSSRLRGVADDRLYERILLDAPCTASGIVRRHPDIPWLRRPADVAQLATQQRRLLEALWPLVAPAGRLLYVVCSVFPEEGARQVAAFLQTRRDARLVALPAGPEHGSTVQLVPADRGDLVYEDPDALPTVHDGFFFALFEKH